MGYPKVIKIFAVIHLLVLVGVAGVILLQPKQYQDSLLFRGDFPAFYAAGKLMKAFPEKLYDPSSQAIVQQMYWPEMKASYLYFAYPPQIALLFRPLAEFHPQLAQSIWIMSQLCCVMLSFLLCNRIVHNTGKNWLWDVLLAFSFLPLTVAVLSGQNTALTMLLLVISIFLSSKEKSTWKFIAGLILGLLAYKPHYLILASAILIPTYGLIVAIGILFSGLCQYFYLVDYMGEQWIADWLSSISFFMAHETIANKDGVISIFSFVSMAMAKFDLRIESFFMWSTIECFVVITVAAVLSKKFLYQREKKDVSFFLLGILPAAIVLLSPHTMYYDFGLLTLSVVLFKYNMSHRLSALGFLLLLSVINLVVAYKPLLFGLFLTLCCLLYCATFLKSASKQNKLLVALKQN